MNRTDHLLWVVAEECAEVAQRASKAARFGLSEIQPGQELTNAQRIVQEYSDLQGVIRMLALEDKIDISVDITEPMTQAKIAKVEKFLEYSRQIGTLDHPGVDRCRHDIWKGDRCLKCEPL